MAVNNLVDLHAALEHRLHAVDDVGLLEGDSAGDLLSGHLLQILHAPLDRGIGEQFLQALAWVRLLGLVVGDAPGGGGVLTGHHGAAEGFVSRVAQSATTLGEELLHVLARRRFCSHGGQAGA